MKRTSTAWLAVALAGGVFVAGCGSSSTTSQTTSQPAATSPAASTATGTPSVPSTQAGLAAVAACKAAIQAQSVLPSSAKAKLEGVCSKAASGDQAAVKKVAQEICEEVINRSPVPPGSAREQALAACKQT